MSTAISLSFLHRLSQELDVTISPSQDMTQLVVSVHHHSDMRWLVQALTDCGYRNNEHFQFCGDGLTINWSGA